MKGACNEKTSKAPTAREEVLRVLEEHAPVAMSPLEISQELPDRQMNTIRKALARMAEEGQVKQRAHGRYEVTSN